MMLALPKEFTYLTDPRIIQSMDYAGYHNFTGRPVAGYQAPKAILTQAAADALIAVQNALIAEHPDYRLKIFDAYRPERAVADFVAWAKLPEDNKTKAKYYPNIDKTQFFNLGYVAQTKSTHSRGSTVDLTICVISQENSNQPTELDMGSCFDYFDSISHSNAPSISSFAKKNRAFLIEIMRMAGFINYPYEWWHFTLENEPFPDTYFDFPIV